MATQAREGAPQASRAAVRPGFRRPLVSPTFTPHLSLVMARAEPSSLPRGRPWVLGAWGTGSRRGCLSPRCIPLTTPARHFGAWRCPLDTPQARGKTRAAGEPWGKGG